MNKIAEEIQKQIDFLKESTTNWVPHQPCRKGQACAVMRRPTARDIITIGYDKPPWTPEQSVLARTAIDILNEETVKYTNNKYKSIARYNDSKDSTKEDILAILKTVRDQYIAIGDE